MCSLLIYQRQGQCFCLRYLPLESFFVGRPTLFGMMVRMPCSSRGKRCDSSLSYPASARRTLGRMFLSVSRACGLGSLPTSPACGSSFWIMLIRSCTCTTKSGCKDAYRSSSNRVIPRQRHFPFAEGEITKEERYREKLRAMETMRNSYSMATGFPDHTISAPDHVLSAPR